MFQPENSYSPWYSDWFAASDRVWFAALSAGVFGLVAVGMHIQLIDRLAPCPLCIFQRFVYLMIGLVAFLGFAIPAARMAWLVAIAGLASLGGGVALYQSGMQLIPAMVAECGFSDPSMIERFVDWLGVRWPEWFLATGFCASRDWTFFGLSMANWSVFCFGGVLALAGCLFWRALRER